MRAEIVNTPKTAGIHIGAQECVTWCIRWADAFTESTARRAVEPFHWKQSQCLSMLLLGNNLAFVSERLFLRKFVGLWGPFTGLITKMLDTMLKSNTNERVLPPQFTVECWLDSANDHSTQLQSFFLNPFRNTDEQVLISLIYAWLTSSSWLNPVPRSLNRGCGVEDYGL